MEAQPGATELDPGAVRKFLVLSLGSASLALGSGALLRPAAIARLFGEASIGGYKADARYYRFLGARDLIIGFGLLVASQRAPGAAWLMARAASDTIDAVTIGLPALRRGSRIKTLSGLGLPLVSIITCAGLLAAGKSQTTSRQRGADRPVLDT